MYRRLLHHGLLTVAVAAWSLAAQGTGTASADAAQVTVVAAGGEQQTLSLEALGAGDVSERAYTLRSVEGESTLTLSGFSPAAILDAAGVDPYGFSYLEVQRPAGGAVLLSRHQALDPSAFPEGPPLVYATAAGTGFLRPNAGAADINASDSFEAPQGVTLVLRNGSPLQVSAHASTVRTRPGRPVTFSALVERAGAGEQLTYSWYFDDGNSSTGPRTRHRFSKRGSYDVVVGVTTPGDDAGTSAVVTVQVGPPLEGPDRKGGGRDEDAESPDHGSATGGQGTPAHAIQSTGSPTPTTKQRQPRAEREPATGKQVSGLLMTSTQVQGREPATPAARTGKLEDGGSGANLPGAALGLLITVGLLGFGALAELRGPFMSLSGTKGPTGAIR